MVTQPSHSEKRRIMAVIALLFIFLACGFAGFLVRTNGLEGMTYNQLIPASDGSLIGIKISIPRDATPDSPIPWVILIHGLSSSKEMMQSLATEFLRRGIGSIAVDLPGHGETTSTLTLGAFNKTSRDMSAVLDHARDLGVFDFSRVAIIGHSLGASVTMHDATHNPDRYQSVVIIGNAGSFSSGLASPFALANETNPKNVLIVIGQQDQLIDIESAQSSLARLIPGDKMEINQLYGDFKDGTARKMVTPVVDHLLEPYEPSAVQEIITWVLTSFDLPVQEIFPLYYVNELCSLIQIGAFFLVLLMIWALVANGGPRKYVSTTRSWQLDSNASISIASVKKSVLIFALAFPVLYAISAVVGTATLFLPGFSLTSVIMPSLAIGLSLWFITASAVAFLLLRRLDREISSLVIADIMQSLKSTNRLKNKVRFGLIMLSLTAVLVLVQQLAFHQDLRVYVPFLRITFDWRRWFAFVVIVVLLAPVFSLEHRFYDCLFKTANKDVSPSNARRMVVKLWLTIFGIRGGILLILGLLQYVAKSLFGPLAFMMMLSMPIVFLLAALTMFNVIALVNDYHSDEVGVLLALLVAMMVGMNLPYVGA